MIPRHMLTDTVEVTPRLGNSATGTLWGNASTYPCIFTNSFEIITDSKGQQVVASANVVFAPDAVVDISARVTKDSRNYEVVEVLPVRNHGRPEHIKVILKSVV